MGENAKWQHQAVTFRCFFEGYGSVFADFQKFAGDKGLIRLACGCIGFNDKCWLKIPHARERFFAHASQPSF